MKSNANAIETTNWMNLDVPQITISPNVRVEQFFGGVINQVSNKIAGDL